jgi:CBS domain-containing protein
MRLSEIMSTPLCTIPPDAGASEARERMQLKRVNHLAVIDGHEVVGVLSSRDLAGQSTEGRSVRELMSRPAVTALPDTTVRQAANLLRGHGIGCLPVIDEGRPVGIVTVSDLLNLVGRSHGGAKGDRWVLKSRAPRVAQKRPRSR